MAGLQAIYYPRFEPDQAWLRGMLLFFDTVQTIVPASANYEPSPEMKDLMEAFPGSIGTLAPGEHSIRYDLKESVALASILAEFSHSSQDQEHVAGQVKRGHNLEVFGVRSMHGSKVGRDLVSNLESVGLLKPDPDKEKRERGFVLIDSRVASLLMSTLVRHLAEETSAIAITDEFAPYFLSSTDHLSSGARAQMDLALPFPPGGIVLSRRDARWMLASQIVQMEIPANIADLKISDYRETRKRFSEGKQSLLLALRDLNDLYLIEDADDPRELQTRAIHATEHLSRSIEQIKSSHLSNVLKKWIPISIGGFVSIGAALLSSPAIAIGAAAASLGIQVIEKVVDKPRLPEGPIEHTANLLARFDTHEAVAERLKAGSKQFQENFFIPF